VSPDYFSVRWTGSFYFDEGMYRFKTYTDDGVRVYVDDQPIINSWYPMRGTRSRYVTPGAGHHTVRIEYFERTQVARAHATWERVGAPQPPEAGQPPAPACPGGPLRLQAWPTETRCVAGGWAAVVYVNAAGGDCRYTYAWERVNKAGPVSGPSTFELWSGVFGAMVGEASVTSGGQTATVGLYIRPPATCQN
jgi:hypothetical protein